MRAFKILVLSVLTLLAHDAPYRLEKFKAALRASKLQAPTSHFDPLYSTPYGAFKAFANRYFYLQDNRYMVFVMCGKKNRSELRFKKRWFTKDEALLEARVKLFPLNSEREFTFLQIHSDPTAGVLSKPLLRIVWKKVYRHKKGHVWAVIRLGAKEEAEYEKVELLDPKNDFHTYRIEVADHILKIYVDGKEKVRKNVRYWATMPSYFKAGIYLQDNGCAKALFDSITTEVKEQH